MLITRVLSSEAETNRGRSNIVGAAFNLEARRGQAPGPTASEARAIANVSMYSLIFVNLPS